MQWPVKAGFQYFPVGVQPKASVKKLLNRYPKTKNIVAHVKYLKVLLTLKMRR